MENSVKNLLSQACRAVAAPLTALSLATLPSPAQFMMISPKECLKLAETDPVLAYSTLTCSLSDRSNPKAFDDAVAVIKPKADAMMDQHVCELAAALHNDAEGLLSRLLGEGLSKWVELRERDRILEAGGEVWPLTDYDPFVELVEKFPGIKIYPLLEERIRDLLNSMDPPPER
jgi:hypothetical protein